MSDLGAVSTLLAPAHVGVPAKQNAARKAAEDFESVFVTQLLESMSQGLKSEGPFTGGDGESTYRSLLNDSIAKEISKHGGIGIANQVYQEILKMQEAKAGESQS